MEQLPRYAIIVAGGTGKRMENSLPKQFIELAGMPILMHTLLRFAHTDSSIQFIVVLPKEQHEMWRELIKIHRFKVPHKVVEGGRERFFSVLNGLKHIPKNALVAIHDGVRPLVSVQTVTACFNAAAEKGSAIPVIPATESIRKIENDKNRAVNRNHYFMVQTPQVYQSEIILKAYQLEFDPLFTDDASVVEKAGFAVHCVAGNMENIKVTRPMDLIIAEALLQHKSFE